MNHQPLPREEATSSIPIDIVLTLVTCGIYDLFWLHRKFRVLNGFLGYMKYSFLVWFFLSIVTCGVYHIYIQYSTAQSINEIKQRVGLHPDSSLPILSLVLTIFGLSWVGLSWIGLSWVVDCIHQDEINRIYRAQEGQMLAQPPLEPKGEQQRYQQSERQDAFFNLKDDDNPYAKK